VVQCGKWDRPMSEKGQQLPRSSLAGAVAIPSIADTKANGGRGRLRPKADSCTSNACGRRRPGPFYIFPDDLPTLDVNDVAQRRTNARNDIFPRVHILSKQPGGWVPGAVVAIRQPPPIRLTRQ
jgi:hypothetical protein